MNPISPTPILPPINHPVSFLISALFETFIRLIQCHRAHRIFLPTRSYLAKVERISSETKNPHYLSRQDIQSVNLNVHAGKEITKSSIAKALPDIAGRRQRNKTRRNTFSHPNSPPHIPLCLKAIIIIIVGRSPPDGFYLKCSKIETPGLRATLQPQP